MDYSKPIDAIERLAQRKSTRLIAWVLTVAILLFAVASLISAIAPGGLL